MAGRERREKHRGLAGQVWARLGPNHFIISLYRFTTTEGFDISFSYFFFYIKIKFFIIFIEKRQWRIFVVPFYSLSPFLPPIFFLLQSDTRYHYFIGDRRERETFFRYLLNNYCSWYFELKFWYCRGKIFKIHTILHFAFTPTISNDERVHFV